MAATKVLVDTPDGLTLHKESALAGTVSGVKSSSLVIHSIVADNALNGAVTFLKMWNVASGSVTIGTTAPDWIIPIPASVKRTMVFPEGLAMTTALTIAATTTAALAGVTGPSSSFLFEILYV